MWLRPLHNNLGWGVAACLYLALAFWLFSFQPSIASDDAFFFMQAIERFSILEFRPHFPGYPGFVILGKALHALGLSPRDALAFLSILSALAIPPLTALAAKDNKLMVFCFALTMPLLPLLGLSMLSDGCGIAFFMAALWQYRKGNMAICGGLLGMVLACRPSFFIPVGVFILWEMVKQKGAIALVLSSAIICLVFFGGVLAIEGMPLLWEALRFIEGHFYIWGNTSLSLAQVSWWDSFLSFQGGMIYGLFLAVAVLYSLYKFIKEEALTDTLWAVCISAWLWTLFFQNPENLRHLALPLILTGLCALKTSKRRSSPFGIGAVCIHGFILSVFIFKPIETSPLEQSRMYFQNENITYLQTNYGVSYLQWSLRDKHVLDRYYAHVLKEGSLDLSSSLLDNKAEMKIFTARILGEKTFYVYGN